jgi:hypothetical protein
MLMEHFFAVLSFDVYRDVGDAGDCAFYDPLGLVGHVHLDYVNGSAHI